MLDEKFLLQVIDVVRQTGDEVLSPGFSRLHFARKADGSLVTEADLEAQTRISDELRRLWPDIHLLGEEMSAAEQRELLQHSTRGLWCLDPLDGTTNYALGVPYFAVSLALIRDQRVQLGVVYDPLRGECFSALAGVGAWLNGVALPAITRDTALADCVALVDFKRLPTPLAQRLASQPPFRSQRNFGSVALDWCWLAAGRGQVYLHGRQNLWDYAAGSLFLAQCGGQAATLEGAWSDSVDLRPRSVLAAMDPGVFRAWRDWLAAAGVAAAGQIA